MKKKKVDIEGDVEIQVFKASEVLDLERKKPRLLSGCKSIDSLIKGFETGCITEVFGEYGTGKTQLALQLSVWVQKPLSEGGLEGKALYIDTEGAYSASRVAEISKARGMDPQKVLGNIFYIKVSSVRELFAAVNKAELLVKEENIKLIVIDSLMHLFRIEFQGRAMLAERQQKLNKLLSKLRKIAEEHDVVVLVTNHVIEKPQFSFLEREKAAGGHVLAHSPKLRLMIRKSFGNKRILRIVDSPYLPPAEIPFQITKAGLEDVSPS